MSGRTRPLARIPGLLHLADTQLGVVSRTQLAELGVTRHHVRRQLDAQRWQTIGPRVVALMTGVLDAEQQLWVAVAHCGGSSPLATLTSLEVQGLRGWEPEKRHVLVPHSTRVPRLEGVVIHQTRGIDPADLVVRRGLPCTSVSRSALDAAAAMPHVNSAQGLLIAVVQQRLATAGELVRELDRRATQPFRASLRTALEQTADGAESLREMEVGALLREAGFTRWQRQVVIQTPRGSRRYDLGVRLADGTLMLLDVDGPHHQDPAVRAVDVAKDAEAIALGHVVFRIPVASLSVARAQLLRQLTRIRVEAERRSGRRNAS
jgi:hypothetical protein